MCLATKRISWLRSRADLFRMFLSRSVWGFPSVCLCRYGRASQSLQVAGRRSEIRLVAGRWCLSNTSGTKTRMQTAKSKSSRIRLDKCVVFCFSSRPTSLNVDLEMMLSECATTKRNRDQRNSKTDRTMGPYKRGPAPEKDKRKERKRGVYGSGQK